MRKLLDRYFSRTEELRQVENYLHAVLKPIPPEPLFVENLKSRLMQSHMDAEPSLTVWQTFALVTAGVFSLIIFIAAGIRTVGTIMGAFGILRYLRGQAQHKRSIPVRTTV